MVVLGWLRRLSAQCRGQCAWSQQAAGVRNSGNSQGWEWTGSSRNSGGLGLGLGQSLGLGPAWKSALYPEDTRDHQGWTGKSRGHFCFGTGLHTGVMRAG